MKALQTGHKASAMVGLIWHMHGNIGCICDWNIDLLLGVLINT
jgi:hypothetical protein